MYVNEQKIINDTKEAFFSSEIQRQKYNSITNFVTEEQYKELHTSPLVPLDIKIDVDKFVNEIQEFSLEFEQWGNQHQELPRYGLALVNETGLFIDDDPINGSLYEWNVNNPEYPILETDCFVPTQAMYIDSLKPLSVFDTHWCRSNILLFKDGAEFKPHIDTLIPSPWIRLWGTTTNNIKLRFAKNNQLIDYGNVEPGRIYVINTALVHDARCEGEEGYQFFLSVFPSAFQLVQGLVHE